MPQYQKAVTKAKIAQILPLMRRFKDALAEWKLATGSYGKGEYSRPTADDIGVSFPEDWECDDEGMECSNDYWDCFPNEEYDRGYVYCTHTIDNNNGIDITMYQPDDSDPIRRGKTACEFSGEKGHQLCQMLGFRRNENGLYDL